MKIGAFEALRLFLGAGNARAFGATRFHQFGHRHQFESARAQRVDDAGQGGDGLRAVAAAVVHQRDTARARVFHHVGVNARRAGVMIPVVGIGRPENHVFAARAGHARQAVVANAIRRAKQARRDAQILLDNGVGALDFGARIARTFRMTPRMIADGMTGLHHQFSRRGVRAHHFADHEKSRGRVLLLQNFQNLRRVSRVWPIVESERENFVVRFDFEKRDAFVGRRRARRGRRFRCWLRNRFRQRDGLRRELPVAAVVAAAQSEGARHQSHTRQKF